MVTSCQSTPEICTTPLCQAACESRGVGSVGLPKRFRSAGDRAALVAEYLLLPHGRKGAWLREHDLAATTIGRWRRMYLFGDLELELEPRDTSGMTVGDGTRMKQLELELARERAARAKEVQRLEGEVDRLNQVNDALGKAIGLLHERSAQQEPPKTRP